MALFKKVVTPLCMSSLMMVGCALPPRGHQEIDFVSARELDTISIVREGLHFLSRSRYVDAEFKFRQGLYRYPDAVNLKINLAEALKGLGDYQQATSIYQDLLKASPDSIQLLVGLARVHLAAGLRENAIMRYEEALELALSRNERPRAAILARSIATLYFEDGQEERALCYSQQAFTLLPDRNQVLRHVRLLTGLGMLQQAETVLTQYIGEDPGLRDAEVLWQFALIEGGRENFAEVLNLIEFARDKNKDRRALNIEMEIFDMVAKYKVKLSGGESIESIDDLLDNVDEEEQQDEGPDFEMSDIEAVNTLYWPARAVVALEDSSDILTKLE